MSTKLQINSLEAIERLIGGDTELELQLRQSVVEAFAKKHLKQLSVDPVIENVATALKSEVTSLLLQKVPVKDNYGRTDFRIELNGLGKKVFDEKIKHFLDVDLPVYVSQLFETSAIKKRIDDQVERQAKLISDQISTAILTRRIDELVQVKIKEKLGIN